MSSDPIDIKKSREFIAHSLQEIRSGSPARLPPRIPLHIRRTSAGSGLMHAQSAPSLSEDGFTSDEDTVVPAETPMVNHPHHLSNPAIATGENEDVIDSAQQTDSSYNGHNGWNRYIEGNIVAIGEEAVCMRWMHNESIRLYYSTYNRLNNWLRIFTAIITGLTAISFISSQYYYVLVIKLLTGLLSIIVIYISTTLKAEDYPNLITKHRLSTYNYYNIFQTINKELSFYRRDRKDAKVFYDYVNGEFNKLKISSPDLDEIVQQRFDNKFSHTGVAMPTHLYHIEVNHRRNNDRPGDAETGTGGGADAEPGTPEERTVVALQKWKSTVMSRGNDHPSDGSADGSADVPPGTDRRRLEMSNNVRNRYEVDRMMLN